jgi:hypothetical protein
MTRSSMVSLMMVILTEVFNERKSRSAGTEPVRLSQTKMAG